VNELKAPISGTGLPPSVLAAQVEALIGRIAANRDRQCAELRSTAEAQMRDLLRSARKDALADVRAAIARERKQSEQALQQAVAAATLEARQRTQAAMRTLLTTMWRTIEAVLEARWADAAQRRSWLEAAVRQADRMLSERSWRIEHGAGWPVDELGALTTLGSADRRGQARKVELACDPALRAGIRIRTAGACLDATAAGLLASRAEVESVFLALFLSPDKPR
jgi:hypothetical protein